MATGTIYHQDKLGYAAGTTISTGLPAYTRTLYIHPDGRWHDSPKHETDDTWPGYFPTEQEAQQALDNAPTPTDENYTRTPMIPVCRVCHTLAPEGLDNHTHYGPGLRMAEVLNSMRSKPLDLDQPIR